MDLSNPWYNFAHHVNKGDSSKAELVSLLRSGHPMPVQMQPLIADLMEGKRRYSKTGPKAVISGHWSQQMAIQSALLGVTRYLHTQDDDDLSAIWCFQRQPSRDDLEQLAADAKAIEMNGGSTREAVLEFVAAGFDVSTRTLEKYLSDMMKG
ncbi:hypothetical protein P1P91_10885 [Halomonas piscis]|uniref:Uncharacterized protein n=1 Tax=Halomonas piscis TaxID=3031727 RepID=A0ABY9YX68_9GAMM|nr:hypothetical protein [Halomonas piscis]WNK19357.1 hypothetical protein P1P91_10885 [Halomonas piscis]